MIGCRAHTELEAEKLALEIEEYQNSVNHLKRSNVELAEALKASPTDVEFQTAVKENEEVIEKRQGLINDLRIQLREMTKGMMESLGPTAKKALQQTTEERPPLVPVLAEEAVAAADAATAHPATSNIPTTGGGNNTEPQETKQQQRQPGEDEAGVYL